MICCIHLRNEMKMRKDSKAEEFGKKYEMLFSENTKLKNGFEIIPGR